MQPERGCGLLGTEQHLWLALRSDAPDEATLAATLSALERARAERLHRREDRVRFMFAHAVLRDVLSRYLRQAAADLAIDIDARGKPRLASDDLHFNLSHSGEAVLIGLARGRDIGVDIEAAVVHDDLAALARQVLTVDEYAALERCAAQEERVMLFHTLWTRKEACLKAWGCGLGIPLREFSVLRTGCAGIRCPDLAFTERLSCRSVSVPDGYAAALAVSGELGGLRCRRWRCDA